MASLIRQGDYSPVKESQSPAPMSLGTLLSSYISANFVRPLTTRDGLVGIGVGVGIGVLLAKAMRKK